MAAEPKRRSSGVLLCWLLSTADDGVLLVAESLEVVVAELCHCILKWDMVAMALCGQA